MIGAVAEISYPDSTMSVSSAKPLATATVNETAPPPLFGRSTEDHVIRPDPPKPGSDTGAGLALTNTVPGGVVAVTLIPTPSPPALL